MAVCSVEQGSSRPCTCVKCGSFMVYRILSHRHNLDGKYSFLKKFIFGCAGSSLLRAGFLQLW